MHTYRIQADALKQVIDKVERLELRKKEIQEDISEVYKEAKSHGFDVKALKHIVKLRKIDENELAEQEALVEVYKKALNMSPEIDEVA